MQVDRRRLVAAGTLMGIGLGGFVDGILFHQLLQIHNMLSNWVPRTTLVNEQINMFWDGVFHSFTWVMTVIAVAMLWRVCKRSTRELSGRTYFAALLLGWGIFNVVEGLIDHEILQVHHVYQNGNFLVWDLVFLCFGLLLIAIGILIIRADETHAL
jgi:uncharacterized membrane protein